MKKLLIYDVAAEETGAKTVLDTYFEKYYNDTNTETFMVTSLLSYPENEHFHNIALPWVKKSRLHRLFCDTYYIQKLVKKLAVDEVLNLQNIALKGIVVPQIVYVHNVIPFSNTCFSFGNERSLWFYKNIIGRLVKQRIPLADRIIVQAAWLKNLIVVQCGFNPNKIVVERVAPGFVKTERVITKKAEYFYPATAFSYKNHKFIIEACKLLKQKNINNYIIYFTLGTTVNYEKRLAEIIRKEELPIKFVGKLNKEQMADYYKKTILIFPSVLETVGLPLLEAQQFDCKIYAADMEYAHDTIGEYKNVCWFVPKNEGVKTLVMLMEKDIKSY